MHLFQMVSIASILDFAKMGKSIVDVGPFNGTVLFCFSMIGTSEAMSLGIK